ncbi:MAG: glycoside hydrolase family 9 protein [Fibrobacteraceae bacterium]|nr:glycoside hydrolase family 9 protein [Fibrobacteraceae bacterium]
MSTKHLPPAIRYNHIGYMPDAPKRILVTNSIAESFSVLDAEGEVILSRPLVPKGIWTFTDEATEVGDFSSLTTPGTYTLVVGDLATKPFVIGVAAYKEQLHSAVKSYYYQRSGEALDASRAGKWARPASQIDDHLLFHSSMNREGKWDGHGGWFDAGDYGKYVVNAGYALSVLMFAQELFANKLNGTGLLEEIRFELEWFLRMQDADGGVFFKVSPDCWDKFVAPENASESRKIVGKSTSSTLNFVAALAQAHNVFAASDDAFAKTCLAAAEKAYVWAIENPNIPAPPYTEGSGPYSDSNLDDDFFWARSMLFRETGNEKLLKRLASDAENEPVTQFSDWRITQNMAYFALALQDKSESASRMARMKLEYTAEQVLKHLARSAYLVPINKFIWGSNGMVASSAMLALVVNSWKKKTELKNMAFEVLDYIYGRNPVNTAFVTGSAWSSPKHPHHRMSAGDGVEDPVPGLLVGGINVDRQDDILTNPRGVVYPHSALGLSYVDLQGAFACNEVAINWNAPLVFVLAGVN